MAEPDKGKMYVRFNSSCARSLPNLFRYGDMNSLCKQELDIVSLFFKYLFETL